jgi:LysR family hydrogen peroxide-inducible transcriptional activator
MTLQQLKYIVALEAHRHFQRAAESCFVAQPTLTLQVQKLEEELGIQIFDRTEFPIQPTELGHKIIEQAKKALYCAEAIYSITKNERDSLDGTFRLGVIPTVAPYLLPLFIKSFTESHPNTHLEIREMQSERIIDALKTNDLDLAIMATPVDMVELREIPLYQEPFLLFAQPHHELMSLKRIKAENLKADEIWILDEGHCLRNQVLNLCESSQGIDNQGFSFKSGSIETLKNMIKYHSGYTIIPELASRLSDDKKFIRRFEDPQPTREIGLVCHQNFARQQLLNKLKESIQSCLPEEISQIKGYYSLKWRDRL